VEFDNQHCGIYAGDWDSYKDFADVFDPIIQEYHGIGDDSQHTSDMDVNNLEGNINEDVPVKSVRIRVGRNIDGYGLSPGITQTQRLDVENLMKDAFNRLESGDLSGTYYPLLGMEEDVRQQLVDDHFLFMSGDPNLQVAGMERDWPEGRGIYHNEDKTFLVWVNEEDQLRIISMQKGGDVRAVFERLANGIKAVEDSLKDVNKEFAFDDKYGFIHSCPTNLGTGMRASVHVDLPGWTAEGLPELKARCEELKLQPRGTRGESGGQTGVTYDISNKHRLGYSEVELVQCMIDGVNALYEEDLELQKKHGV